MKKIFTQIAVAFGCLFLAGCDTVFDVHPYDVHVDGDKNVNAANIAKIESAIKYKDTIRFAMISDTHQWLDDLKKEVNDINRRKDSIDFVLHCGDVTDFGATQEFQWTRDRLQKLKMPFVVLLGNHDCLGTGNQTYEVVFAAPYSEQFNNNVAKVFNYYTHQFPGLMFCLYGHGHHTKQTDMYGDGTMYYEICNAPKHQYYIFTITPKGYRYEIIDY